MASQTQDTQTQEGDEYAMYDQSFDASTTLARLISTSNVERFKNVLMPRHQQPGKVYSFGRHKTCDFILPGHRFSNIHFRIWEQDGWDSKHGESNSVILVEDLSTNGTFLNQARIGKGQRAVLANGDELAAGIGVADDEVRYLVQIPRQHRPAMPQGLGPHAMSCIQKYEIREILGAGAFAIVRIAIDRKTGHKYAVKILNQRKLAITNANSQAATLFKREIEILQSTRHPNIVQYVDMWADNADVFLMLEFLPGGDLMDYIMRRKRLSEYESAKIIEQILCALVYCHKIGIAHRDIKPENILMTRDEPPIVKLTDFGLAKMVEPGSFLKTFCGTLTYVAPEVISMHGKIDGAYSTAVDMWSVGCVVFIMVAGSMPFIAEDQDAMMKAITAGNYDDAMLDEIELSGAGLDFVESLLRVNPAARMTGEEAQKHPWLTTIDHEFPNGRAYGKDDVQDEMDHDSQDTHSQEIRRLEVGGHSRAFDLETDPWSSQQDGNVPKPQNGYGLRTESSVDWNRVENGSGAHFEQSQKQEYLARLNSQRGINDNLWNASRFSDNSSVNFMGSSQYVSAASQAQLHDSNATITPQRLKRTQQQLVDKGKAQEETKENSVPQRQRVYGSESAFERT